MKIILHKFRSISLLIAVQILFLANALGQSEIIPDRLTVSADSMSNLAFFPSRSAPANVTSVNVSRIPAEISAIVVAIPVRVGDVVSAGELLAQLDCRQAQLNYDIESARSLQLTAALEFDRRDLVRREKLIAGGNIGEADLDRSQNLVISKENELAAQQAVQSIAELNTQRCLVRAPYAGVITERLANVGENLALGQALVELVQLDELEVVASIALDNIDSFNEAEGFIFEESGTRYILQLGSLLPVVESNSRLREARFIFSQDMAVTGSSGRVVWETPRAHVPARFLQLRDNVAGVFVLENNQAKFIPVTEAQEGRPVPFDMPLSTMIVTDGRYGLVDGQQINLR